MKKTVLIRHFNNGTTSIVYDGIIVFDGKLNEMNNYQLIQLFKNIGFIVKED